MKALIFSDSHGTVGAMIDSIEANPDVNLIIHAGDIQRDIDDIMCVYPNIPCAYVVGNNDYFIRDGLSDRFFEFGGKKIFLTHGHNYGVKMSVHRVVSEAKKRGADVCIFGHTHNPYISNDDIWVVNPGPANRSYAVLIIKDNKISIEIKDI